MVNNDVNKLVDDTFEVDREKEDLKPKNKEDIKKKVYHKINDIIQDTYTKNIWTFVNLENKLNSEELPYWEEISNEFNNREHIECYFNGFRLIPTPKDILKDCINHEIKDKLYYLEKNGLLEVTVNASEFYDIADNDNEKKFIDYYLNQLSAESNEVKFLNTNQYKIVLDPKNKFKSLKLNDEMFYNRWKDTKFKKFITEAFKIVINHNMCLIPLKRKIRSGKHKGEICYMFLVDNESNRIEKHEISSFTFLNKQSNLFDVLEINLPDEIGEDNKQLILFKKYLLRSANKHVSNNVKLLEDIYGDKSAIQYFYKDNKIITI